MDMCGMPVQIDVEHETRGCWLGQQHMHLNVPGSDCRSNPWGATLW